MRSKMPLLPGKKNFVHNLKAELQAGKPRDQALAIAYDKEGEHKAEGGEADADTELLDQVSAELLQAIETKDKSLLTDALCALINHIQSENQSEGSE